MRDCAARALYPRASASTRRASHIDRRSWLTTAIEMGAPNSSTMAAGWKKPVKAVDMCWRVKKRLTARPSIPTMMFMACSRSCSFAEALQRLDDLQVVRVDRQHRLPGVARELLFAELLVERALHGQDPFVVGVVALQRHELDQRDLVVPRLVEVLHLGERQQVAGARL